MNPVILEKRYAFEHPDTLDKCASLRAVSLIEIIDLAVTCFSFIPDPTWQTPPRLTGSSWKKSKPTDFISEFALWKRRKKKKIPLFYQTTNVQKSSFPFLVHSWFIWPALHLWHAAILVLLPDISRMKIRHSCRAQCSVFVPRTAGLSVRLLWEGFQHLPVLSSHFPFLCCIPDPSTCSLLFPPLMAIMFTIANSWPLGCSKCHE